ncbi:hypothetical protein FQR65_LT11725 [Abscondita terminalis]|nr:hypothetical protein FQR65_LT11725 [Abscondita terminalis]
MDANQQKLTPAQKTTLIDFIHSRPNMQTKRFSATYTKEMSHALWGQIATILNAMPGGAVKDANMWSKTYRDLINNMKKKKSREINHAQGTGGCPPLLPDKPDDLTTEEKILDILSPTAIEGNIDVPDPAEEK